MKLSLSLFFIFFVVCHKLLTVNIESVSNEQNSGKAEFVIRWINELKSGMNGNSIITSAAWINIPNPILGLLNIDCTGLHHLYLEKLCILIKQNYSEEIGQLQIANETIQAVHYIAHIAYGTGSIDHDHKVLGTTHSTHEPRTLVDF